MKHLLIYLLIGVIYALIIWVLEREIRQKGNLTFIFKLCWFSELIVLWPVELGYEIYKKVKKEEGD